MTLKLRQESIALVEKAQKGDRHAYSQIVKQFQNLAVGYAYSILRNFPLAEEAAQEAFIEAYLNLKRLRKPAAFPGWLKKIVFKQCDRLTRKKRLPVVSDVQTGEIISSQSSPSAIAERRELQQIVTRAIELLPNAEREVITLFYIGERSQKEISAFLEVPVSTVKNRLFNARKKLKTNFSSMVEDYLYNQRPSQNNDFTDRVERIIDAASDGDETAMQTPLQQDSRLANTQANDIKTTPLTNASHRGYLKIVKLLVLFGADVNAKEGNYSQSTALHWAAADGHLNVVKFLVSKGAKIDVADNWHNLTPLGWATIVQYPNLSRARGTQHREVREFLLEQGAKLDIFSAIALDDLKSINTLIKANPELLKQRLGFVNHHMQPLHYAISEHKNEIAKLLIQQGADLQATTRFGVTPLCLATQQGDRDLVRLLNEQNVSQLATLLVSEQLLQADKLIEQQPSLVAENTLLLHYLIEIKSSPDTISWLIDRGANIEVKAKYQIHDYVSQLTPLHAAVRVDSVEITQLLIEKNANINAKTKGELQITALHGAAARGNLAIIRLLAKHKADLNIEDNINIGTALDWAKEFEQPTAIELLENLSNLS